MNYYTDVLKKYAVFEGRARRKEYWVFLLVNFIVAVILSVILHLIVLQWIYSLAILVPSIAVGVRRLHDTNRSGLWLLLVLIPLVGAIILIVFLVQNSTPGDNQYGPNPKGNATVTTTAVH